MTTYFGILTKVGEAKEANAKALGIPLEITEMEIGDGGGVLPVPNREQSSLIGSKHRAPVNRRFVHPNNPGWLVVEQVIPEQFGGWWARELGLRDADGDLIAVSNCPPTYKPQMAEGSARTQVVRMVLQVSSTSNFTLKIDPSVVLAMRSYVDEEVATRLGKADTAEAAKKLATARQFSISGAARAEAKSFDGRADIELELTDLDMSKAKMGTLAVSRGGTGLTSVPDGHVLIGTSDGKLRTAEFSSLLPTRRYPLIYSITDIPKENQGPIIVAECSEVWIWTITAHFAGYRSPHCGRPVDGHTVNPLSSELDAVGGIVPKASYGGLWAYAIENGLVLTQANWDANRGGHYFVDVDANRFRLPDLRDMFRRFSGTDADSAGVRPLGSRQMSANLAHFHVSGFGGHNISPPPRYGITETNINSRIDYSGDGSFVSSGANSSTAGGSEARPRNTAYNPRIHI